MNVFSSGVREVSPDGGDLKPRGAAADFSDFHLGEEKEASPVCEAVKPQGAGYSGMPPDSGEEYGYTIILDAPGTSARNGYRETPLPPPGKRMLRDVTKETVPERIRQMRHLYVYGRNSAQARAENFCLQGKFMEDFEDDAPWTGDFFCYFPTYHDLYTRQLRGYFSWRTLVRKGEFRPIAASAAYIYLYELLNGIGASSPEDSLQKLKAFETGFIDPGMGDANMRRNLRRWMLEMAVVQDVPPETAALYDDPELVQKDASLSALRCPDEHTDEEIFAALCRFGRKDLARSPVMALDADRGRRLFGETWRAAASRYQYQGKDLFALCFGERLTRPWFPLANAVYCWPDRLPDREYVMDQCRAYRCRDGRWEMEAYEKLRFDRYRMQSFVHETDLKLRRYLKTGSYLRSRPEDAWVTPFAELVIEADRQAADLAARPQITLDLSGLDQIRRDALITRDSLLTEEERIGMEEIREHAAVNGEEAPAAAGSENPAEEDAAPAKAGNSEKENEALVKEENPKAVELLQTARLDAVQLQILYLLLQGKSPAGILKEHFLMPSVAADSINEALFDEIGDIVVLCEDDELSLVDDYIEDIRRLSG